MPNIPNHRDDEDAKEVRLFGDKSIREEAYRQKILELEKDVMNLESLLKSGQLNSKDTSRHNEDFIPETSEYSDALAYEARIAELDKKINKYQKILEAKARTISDRLTMQAQNLIETDKIHKNIIIFKAALLFLFLLSAISIALSITGIYSNRFNTSGYLNSEQEGANFYRKSERIKKFLQTNGLYRNQYTILSLNYYDRICIGTVELHFDPSNNWSLKMIASDLIETFKRVSTTESLELTFVYKGSASGKVNFSPVLNETHFDFFTS